MICSALSRLLDSKSESRGIGVHWVAVSIFSHNALRTARKDDESWVMAKCEIVDSSK